MSEVVDIICPHCERKMGTHTNFAAVVSWIQQCEKCGGFVKIIVTGKDVKTEKV